MRVGLREGAFYDTLSLFFSEPSGKPDIKTQRPFPSPEEGYADPEARYPILFYICRLKAV
jgi:hypothetical protein